MASSSSSLSAPAYASRPCKYHVFLSFRGKDTRNNFAGHLYSALDKKGIDTYMDDKTLPRGDEIHPSLMDAIDKSQIAIVIFSENYAESKWCLNELEYILKCKNTRGLIVMPIFYKVDLDDLKRQKGKYGEAFDNHKKVNETKAELWRNAIVDATRIAGWDSNVDVNKNESEFINKIVNEVSRRKQPLTPSANPNLIGLGARMQDLISKLQIGSGGVRMIGIWGVGGGGKTTLAHSVYTEISKEFDGCCMVGDIRDKSSKSGLENLQKLILNNVLKQDKVDVGSVVDGKQMISDGLSCKKVLIVLDDVNHSDQLEALAGSHNWFGDGSRIIITTRDRHVLIAHQVDVVHTIQLLNHDEAIKLLRKISPQDNKPKEDYERLSEDVVSYADGLPLALIVLGRSLCKKGIDKWKSALARLKEIPNDDIVGKLQISFEELTMVQKNLFLDIACFFRGAEKDLAMEIFEACGFYPDIGVDELIQKALISISEYGRFDMHDLVQEMAHHVVREQLPHSRVWKQEDIVNISAMDTTTELDMIEAIRYEYSWDTPLQHLPPIVANTKNLRWIIWDGKSANHLPSSLIQSKLCCLILRYSPQKQLWECDKQLQNLKIMEFRGLKNLITTPDFGGLPNLEKFTLTECWKLEKIHPSIGHLKRLVLLRITYCQRLKMCPPITGPKKLETLSFEGCIRLNLSEIQQLEMDNLYYLFNNREKEIASNIESSTDLDNLGHHHLNDSGSEVASSIKSSTDFFLTWLTYCCSKDLKDLNLSACRLGDEEIGSTVWDLPNLTKLNLSRNEFSQLNFTRLRLPRLKWLNVSNCKELVELSELPSSIAAVNADWCESLESFGDISNCKWLWNVSLLGNNKLVSDILLDSMLQGNASEDYFINITLKPHIPKSFVGRLFREKTITLDLLDDWYNGFWGFSICFVPHRWNSYVDIVIKQEVDKDSLFGDWQKSNEAVEPEYGATKTCVGYISFGSLRHTAFSNSSDTMISVSLRGEGYIGARLIPRKSEGDQPRTTKVAADSSEFWDEELGDRPQPFKIIHDSKSSINITWKPWDNWL